MVAISKEHQITTAAPPSVPPPRLVAISKEHQITTSSLETPAFQPLVAISKEHQITTPGCSPTSRSDWSPFPKNIKSQPSPPVGFFRPIGRHFQRTSNHNNRGWTVPPNILVAISKEHQITTAGLFVRQRLSLVAISKEHQITTPEKVRSKGDLLVAISKEHQITTHRRNAPPALHWSPFPKNIKSQPSTDETAAQNDWSPFPKNIKSQPVYEYTARTANWSPFPKNIKSQQRNLVFLPFGNWSPFPKNIKSQRQRVPLRRARHWSPFPKNIKSQLVVLALGDLLIGRHFQRPSNHGLAWAGEREA